MESTKICSKCKIEKNTTEFYINKNSKEGIRSQCKICMNLSRKQYRDKNIEKARFKEQQYREENREKFSKSNKKYAKANKDKIFVKNKRYRENNKEKLKEKSRTHYRTEKHQEYIKKYYEENKDKISKRQKQRVLNQDKSLKEVQKRYRQSEKGKISEKNKYHKRRAKYKKGSLSNKQLAELYKKVKKCYWCNCKIDSSNTHLDHYIPLSKGGEHTLQNIVLSCCKCNLEKGAKSPEEFAITKGKLL